MKKNRAFSVVEVVVAIAIAAALLGVVYKFLARGFMHGEIETKNLVAIQEMVFIIHNLRSDLRTMVEYANDSDSYASYDAAAKSLTFSIVSGVTNTGIIVYSKNIYCFENNCLVKKFQLLEENGLSAVKTMKLASAGKITGFEVSILDADGNPVTNPRKPGKPSRFLKMKIIHASNARLEIVINIYSTYMKKQNEELGKYWLPGWKLKTISPDTYLITNTGTLDFNVQGNPNVSASFNGIKIGGNMGAPGGMK